MKKLSPMIQKLPYSDFDIMKKFKLAVSVNLI